MLTDLALVAGGLVLLTWGADRVVLGAGATARRLGVAPLLVGLTVVGFATSAPELLVAVTASLRDSPALAVGNAVGSNIANVGLVLGAAVLLCPMAPVRGMRRELLLLLAITALALWVFADGQLSRGDGLILLMALVLAGALALRTALAAPARLAPAPLPGRRRLHDLSLAAALLWLAAGLVALLAGAQLTVIGAGSLARVLGVSELLIGLTVVAIGTSLPELAISLAGALRGQHELALGNLVGSNIFNLLGVVGVAATLRPMALDAGMLRLHLPVMTGLTLALCLMAYNWPGRNRITRPEGAMLLAAFIGYHGYIIAQQT